MSALERKIPLGCPLLADSKVKMIRLTFILVCKAKQEAGARKKAKSAYGQAATHNIAACSICPIGKEVNKGTFRRPVPDQVSFIHPCDVRKYNNE